METLLEDVSTISKAQRLTVPQIPISLKALVDRQVEELEDVVMKTEAVITVADDLPTVSADEIWVGRAVHNLLSNAIKFAKPDEAPDVSVEAYRGPEGEGIVVKDRGIGLPENATDRIFELFRRGVARSVEGTGVGLAIVKKVATKHGGMAWFAHRENGGAEFYMTFSRIGA